MLELTANRGAAPEERSASFPCDALCDGADAAYYRAVTVRTDAERLFRWLGRLRVAPYSYDWIDNRGRRSPQTRSASRPRRVAGRALPAVSRISSRSG